MAKNETSREILSYNKERFKNNFGYEIEEKYLNKNIEYINPIEKIYWNVWIDTSYDRGVPNMYDFQGKIIIYFLINADNCEPIKFEAIINWTYENWNQPEVKIKQKNKYINNDKGV